MNIEKQKAFVAWLSVASNSVLVLLKIIIGAVIGSVSVISEAIHSGIDLLASGLALFAVKESNRPADERHPYGHGKFENISGTIEAVLIFAAAIWIITKAVHKFQHPVAIESVGWGVMIMLLSTAMNIAVSSLLFKTARKSKSIALEADGWHLRTDVYTSFGVMFALIVIWTGQRLFPGLDLAWVDPFAALIVAIMIMKAAYDLTARAARDLFDISLPREDLDWIHDMLREMPQIMGVHNMKSRKSGKDRFIELHLVVDPELTVAISHKLTDEVTAAIRAQLPDSYVTIHVEPCNDNSCDEKCRTGCFKAPLKK